MQCKVLWYSVKCPDIPEELIAPIIRADDENRKFLHFC
jgi:hypothetical protein